MLTMSGTGTDLSDVIELRGKFLLRCDIQHTSRSPPPTSSPSHHFSFVDGAATYAVNQSRNCNPQRTNIEGEYFMFDFVVAFVDAVAKVI